MELFMVIVFILLFLILLSIEGILKKVHKTNSEILDELQELRKR
jgi:hypothetical protein